MFAVVDGFASYAVVEFMWLCGAGEASWMTRPLASDSERTEWSDVHGVDNRKSSLGASPEWARSGHRRWERRDIKVEIDAYLFCHNEATVPTIHNLL